MTSQEPVKSGIVEERMKPASPARRLREEFFKLDSQFIIKGYDKDYR